MLTNISVIIQLLYGYKYFCYFDIVQHKKHFFDDVDFRLRKMM